MKSLSSKIIFSRWLWTHESKAVFHALKLLFVRIASGVLFLSGFVLPLRYHLPAEDTFSRQWGMEFQMPNIMLHLLIKLCVPLLGSRGDIIWPRESCFFVFFFSILWKNSFQIMGHLVLCHLPSQHWRRRTQWMRSPRHTWKLPLGE